MVDHLATLIDQFPGAANQTRCFAHILNLVAKSILHQFDMPKKTAEGDLPGLDNATEALAALEKELEVSVAQVDDDIEEGDDDEVDEDDEEGLGHERDNMSEEEVAALDDNLVPIRLMLTKVSQKII
jgi:hypothetical protein